MDEQEQRDLARRLADDSEVLDFETALEVARHIPAEAEKLIREREELAKVFAALADARAKFRAAARELT
jgi:hypothetical protein